MDTDTSAAGGAGDALSDAPSDTLSAAVQAAALLRACADPDDALGEALDLIALSAQKAPAAMAAGAHMIASTDAADRETGFLLLRMAADLHEEARTGVASMILAALRTDTEHRPRVRSAAALALGFTQDPRAVGLLAELARDPDADVRFHVAVSLPKLCGAGPGDAHERAVNALIGLSRDPDPHVRDWATFGLGTVICADTPEIRAALADRLDDEDGQTRKEAITGLARRRDPCAVGPLAELLGRDASTLHEMYDAVALLAAPELLPVLRELEAANHDVAELLLLSDPVAREQCGRFAWTLLALLDHAVPDAGFALGSRRFAPGFELWRTRAAGHDEDAGEAPEDDGNGGTSRWDVPTLYTKSAGDVDAAARIVLDSGPDDEAT